MHTHARFFLSALAVAACLSGAAYAQTTPARQAEPATQAPASADPVANELALLRRSVQTLNTRLREISEKLLAANVRQGGGADESQRRVGRGLELLGQAEQRAELMRKQLLELTEKEMAFRARLVQVEEDMRPDSIERSVAFVGSTRTPELRDVRRRVLENERKGVESLLGQAAGARQRLEEDVRQADSLVARIRQRVLPLIEKEVDKIDPAQP